MVNCSWLNPVLYKCIRADINCKFTYLTSYKCKNYLPNNRYNKPKIINHEQKRLF